MAQMRKSKPLRANVVFTGHKQNVICPVCEYVLKDDKDVKSVRIEGACDECVLTFKFAHKQKWLSGWRPSKDEARLKMHI